MKPFTRLMIAAVLAVLVGIPMAGASRGWGLGSETNTRVIAEAGAFCPSAMRLPDGRCQRTHRSYYFGRSRVGGGPNSGK